MLTPLDRLKQIGLLLAGTWHLDVYPRKLHLRITSNNEALNVLYALVVSDEVKYIGESTIGFRARMRGYRNPGLTQRTNMRNNRNIRAAINEGKEVCVYAFFD